VELYWYEPEEDNKSIRDLKSFIKLITSYITYPIQRYKKSKELSTSKPDVDNTLSDLISISKHHGEDTYHFSLNSKDTNNNSKLKFPKSTSTTNFRTTHYDKDTSYTDMLQDCSNDSDKSLNDSDDDKENKINNQNVNGKTKSEKSNSKIGYVIKNGKKDKKNDQETNGKILLDGKEVDIKNFASEIKKEIKQFEGVFNYEETLKNATGFRLFLFKYGFQKRNEITYQVEVNGYILNDENLRE